MDTCACSDWGGMAVMLAALGGLACWALGACRGASASGRSLRAVADREHELRRQHECLVQGMLGLVMQLQAAVSQMPEHDRFRRSVEASMAAADRLLAQSQESVGRLVGEPVAIEPTCAGVLRALVRWLVGRR